MSYTSGHTSLSYGLGAAPAKADMSAFEDPRAAVLNLAQILRSPTMAATRSPVAAVYSYAIQDYVDGAERTIATAGEAVAAVEGAIGAIAGVYMAGLSIYTTVALATLAGTEITVGSIVSAVVGGTTAGGTAAAGATGPFALVVMAIVVIVVVVLAVVMAVVGAVRVADLKRQAKEWSEFRASLVTQMLPKAVPGYKDIRPTDFLIALPGTPTERSFRHGNEGGEALTVESESITGTAFRSLETMTSIPVEARGALRTLRSLVAWSRQTPTGGAEYWVLYLDLIAHYWQKGIITPQTWGEAWLKLIRPYGWDGRGNPLGPNQEVDDEEWKPISKWAPSIAALFAQNYATSQLLKQGVPDFVVQAKLQPTAQSLWTNIGPDATVTRDVNGGDWLAIDQRPLFLAFQTVEEWSKKYANAKALDPADIKRAIEARKAAAIGVAGGITPAKLAAAQACKAKGGKATWNAARQDYDCALPVKRPVSRDVSSSASGAPSGGLLAALLLATAGGLGWYVYKRSKGATR